MLYPPLPSSSILLLLLRRSPPPNPPARQTTTTTTTTQDGFRDRNPPLLLLVLLGSTSSTSAATSTAASAHSSSCRWSCCVSHVVCVCVGVVCAWVRRATCREVERGGASWGAATRSRGSGANFCTLTHWAPPWGDRGRGWRAAFPLALWKKRGTRWRSRARWDVSCLAGHPCPQHPDQDILKPPSSHTWAAGYENCTVLRARGRGLDGEVQYQSKGLIATHPRTDATTDG